MLKLFEKYLDFSSAENVFLKEKIANCKTVEEGFEVLNKAGWNVNSSITISITEDSKKDEEEIVKETESKTVSEDKAKAKAVAEEVELKSKVEKESKIAKVAKEK